MNLRSRNGLLLLLLLCCAAALSGQSRVNPTVKVLPRAATPVPAECDEGLAPPAVPRVETAEVQPAERDQSADLLPPPSRDLRAQLSATLQAAERGDRETFKTSLAAVKATVASYPPGGERNAANETIAVLNDIERLWEYQYSSPVGAFFDETVQGGNLLASLRKYRGYDEFIRENVFTDANGTRLYPSRESRDFLVRQAADRLPRVGISQPRTPSTATATPTVRTTTPDRPATATATPAPKPSTAGAAKPAPTRTARATTPSPRPRRSSRTAARRSAPREPENEGTPTETSPKTTTTATTARSSPAPRATAPAARTPVREPAATATETAPPETTATESTTTESTSAESTTTESPTATDTTATDTAPSIDSAFTTDTTDTGPVAPAPPTAKRSVILPIILILVGVGVLILLFRASS